MDMPGLETALACLHLLYKKLAVTQKSKANPPMSQDTPLATHDADEDARNCDIKIDLNGDIVHRD
jgi:hypothetical protein